MSKYYTVKQHDITDCGAACLATISRQHGLKIPITKIREIAGTDKQGTNAYGLIKAAESLGFTAKGVKGDQEAFFSEFPLPCIAHVIVDEALLHYVVIHNITKTEVIIADPAKGLLKKTPEDFFKEWTGVLVILVPDVKFEKGDLTKGIFQRFFGLLKPQKHLMVHVFVASMLYTLLGILGAFYFKLLLDDILPYSLMNSLHILSIGIILLTIFKVLLNAFRSQLLLYLSQRIDIPLILGYYNHVVDLPLNFFGTRKVGEIISRFMDAGHIREAISGATLTIMIDTVMALVGGIILYMHNPLLFGISLIMLMLYGALVFAFNKPIREMNRMQMEENSQLTSYLVESLNGIETIKAYNAERETKEKTEFRTIKLLKTVFKMGTMDNLRQSLTGLISGIGGIVILWVGAIEVLNGRLSIGQLLVFNALLAYFIEPVANLINLQPMMQTAIVASDRLGEILDLDLEKSVDDDKKIRPASLKGNILFKHVDFRYGTRHMVLSDISMEIKAGERIALVGESGSGKTTLVKLLMDLYSAEKGDILISGNHIKDISLEVLREHIAYVPQDTFLFSGSIEENLRLGTYGKTMEDLVEACKLASAHDFINEMPLRYQSRLEENGANLSGGQRQRLSIARAILKKPDILILDEATSSLDSMTEKAIERTIEHLSLNITTIIIAHRLSTIMGCDKIYVMDKGTIMEVGSHSELIAKRGRYFDMWKDQLPEFWTETAEKLEVTA
jgi:ATP-binding cassette subfamily B protein